MWTRTRGIEAVRFLASAAEHHRALAEPELRVHELALGLTARSTSRKPNARSQEVDLGLGVGADEVRRDARVVHGVSSPIRYTPTSRFSASESTRAVTST